ncbi:MULTISPECIES: hypothetical protein [Bacillus cereus group]|uniref:hypothetical protein n=1 Tax=Bacillus cereus group TaxID=86661 RepID=UPI0011459DCA|nr:MULTISPECIES: hypothetical protein [Bacillus cereus group]MCU7679065.1 hypothetical protein [Bacillus thuringiensis]NRQ71002.1 hypothetical protein [Bacillus cereus]
MRRSNTMASPFGLVDKIWISFLGRNIVIEYQGVQYGRPIVFFVGEEQFLRPKERDERKARLYLENKCKLIYVREGYLKREVLLAVEQALAKQKDKL